MFFKCCYGLINNRQCTHTHTLKILDKNIKEEEEMGVKFSFSGWFLLFEG